MPSLSCRQPVTVLLQGGAGEVSIGGGGGGGPAALFSACLVADTSRTCGHWTAAGAAPPQSGASSRAHHCGRRGSAAPRARGHRPTEEAGAQSREQRKRGSRSGRGEVPAMQPPPPPEVAGEDESSCRGVFMDFMSKVTQFEKLAESGERLLGRFCKELEYFLRPPIRKESDVMNQILKSNFTVRMRSYIEAGCRLHCQNISNINQLSSCEDRLKDHIKKVKTLLEELECLVENIYGITLAASLSALEVSDRQCLDNMLSTDCCSMEGASTQEEDKSADQLGQEGDKSADQLDMDVSFVTVMVMVRNMLKLDYMMQEKIVSALSLKTPSLELEGYCLMWNLRPYIDDDVMNLAWKMCP